jgi:hypothetical protein
MDNLVPIVFYRGIIQDAFIYATLSFSGNGIKIVSIK